jgi:3-hydroxyacyl-CoA dehydrogenase
MRLWTLDDEVLIASIKTKVHAIGPGVIEGLLKGIALAETGYKGLVIWSGDDPFSTAPTCRPCCPPS